MKLRHAWTAAQITLAVANLYFADRSRRAEVAAREREDAANRAVVEKDMLKKAMAAGDYDALFGVVVRDRELPLDFAFGEKTLLHRVIVEGCRIRGTGPVDLTGSVGASISNCQMQIERSEP